MEAALSQRTWRNKALQVRSYILYMKNHNANILKPSLYEIMSYLLELSVELKSPLSVLNYCSDGRTFVKAINGSTAGFDTYAVGLVRKCLQCLSNHMPTVAPPLMPQDVQVAIRFFRTVGTNSLPIIAVLLISYFTLLRQSNILTIISHEYLQSHHTYPRCHRTPRWPQCPHLIFKNA